MNIYPYPLRRRTLVRLSLGLWVALAGCGGSQPGNDDVTAEPSQTTLKTRLVQVAGGLSSPWGMVFLPDGSMLVTEKGGQMRIVDATGRVSTNIGGVPTVASSGQGGLLDVQLDPDFATSPWIYWSYAEPGTGADAGLAGTAVARGQLQAGNLTQVQVLFRQWPKVAGTNHFGARLAFGKDKHLFITLGERQQDDPANPGSSHAQNLAKTLGKVVRINRDGSIPADNPDFGATEALPGIWSLGHRNPQGAAIHPTTGELWASEHGPQGGDEINLIKPGRNYGWPIKSYGCPYGAPQGDACRVGGGVHAPNFEEPLTYWVPTSTAPSGMVFNVGSRYPGWEGNLFVGSLAGQTLWRLTVDNSRVLSREALYTNQIGRIRHVAQDQDGWLYLLTDDGHIYKITL